MTTRTADLTVRATVLHADSPAVIVPITAGTEESILNQAEAGVAAGAGLLEWRADHLLAGDAQVSPADLLRVGRLLRGVSGQTPLLFTIRTGAEGGLGPSGGRYREILTEVIRGGAMDLVDIEYRRDGARELFGIARESGVPVVASFHNFDQTPEAQEIQTILAEQEDMGAAVAKVAVMPRSSADVATLLLATARRAETARVPLITMSMNGLGAVSRVAGHIFGSAATFAMVGEPSAPGQVEVGQLRELMHGLDAASDRG